MLPVRFWASHMTGWHFFIVAAFVFLTYAATRAWLSSPLRKDR